MSAHTKGPWVVEAGGPRLVNTHACVISAADGLGPVAYSTREYARLVAAAPDLLAACQAQHHAIDVLMARLIALDPEFMPTKSTIWPALVAGSDAIAKATGGAS